MCIIIIIHKFHRDASLETKLQGRYAWPRVVLTELGVKNFTFQACQTKHNLVTSNVYIASHYRQIDKFSN